MGAAVVGRVRGLIQLSSLLTLLGANVALAAAEGVCSGISAKGAEARGEMVSQIVGSPERRSLLVQELLANGGGACRQILTTFVEDVLSRKDSPSDKGRSALLLLALRGRIPRVNEILSSEIREGRGDDLLSALKEADPARYREALLEWVREAAAAVRTLSDIPVGNEAEYGGKGLREQDAARLPLRLASPLVFERCLRLLKGETTQLSGEELASLNVIYAASTSAYRQAFQGDLVAIVVRQVSTWIPQFRREPVWVQARLFPLMTAVGGPEVVRELMWLSKNHADLRVRGLADHALDALLSGKSK